MASKIWGWEQKYLPVQGPKRRRRGGRRCPELTIAEILAWADAHREAHGAWPHRSSGTVSDAPHFLTWKAVESALAQGHRGLPGGSTLADLLARHRDVAKAEKRPRLTVAEILAWADAHQAATGAWPKSASGIVRDAPHAETWQTINSALAQGCRGLRGGLTLPDLLAQHRGVPKVVTAPRLTVDEILVWADAHHAATGEWPGRNTGLVRDASHTLTWQAVGAALTQGHRGLPGGTSLGDLLAEHRGVAKVERLPRLTIAEILAWADAHHAATGAWPTRNTGLVAMPRTA